MVFFVGLGNQPGSTRLPQSAKNFLKVGSSTPLFGGGKTTFGQTKCLLLSSTATSLPAEDLIWKLGWRPPLLPVPTVSTQAAPWAHFLVRPCLVWLFGFHGFGVALCGCVRGCQGDRPLHSSRASYPPRRPTCTPPPQTSYTPKVLVLANS